MATLDVAAPDASYAKDAEAIALERQAVGIAVGLICSAAAATLMRGLLFGTRAGDVPTLAAVAAVLGISALLASYILPARRA